MTKHDEIWKKMTTPIEVNIGGNELFSSVRFRFKQHLSAGTCVKCPLSGTIHNMPYRRSISKGMARALKLIYRIQVSKINDGTAPNSFSDFTKLRYWGFIRQNDVGHWLINDYGIKFVEGDVRVAKYAVVVNNAIKEYMGDSISIHEILSK